VLQVWGVGLGQKVLGFGCGGVGFSGFGFRGFRVSGFGFRGFRFFGLGWGATRDAEAAVVAPSSSSLLLSSLALSDTRSL